MQPIDINTKNSEPKAVALLRDAKISYRLVGRACKISPDIVNNALNLDKFGTVTHKKLVAIRMRVVALLEAAGKDVPENIWDEYDATIKRAA